MRVAVANHFAGQPVAETELARRICLAAGRLGWSAHEVATSVEVKALAPDFVIALHFFTPKLTGHPTYGCLWNPPSFIESDQRHVASVLGYDGYLSSSQAMTAWLQARLDGTPKRFFVTPFYASCNRTPYRAPALDTPRLLYAGTNWDGARHRDLFAALDAEPYLDVHGPPDRWAHLRRTYRGQLPFDGTSLLEALHRAGVGLCLHRDEHRAAGTPSARIFEIVTAGAIAICQEHPFIREQFGDSVLYLDESPGAPDLAVQIRRHMAWIASHPERAREMARTAHAVFEGRFALEDLLEGVATEHRRLVVSKGFVRSTAAPAATPAAVEYVVRTGRRASPTLHRALDSLAAQTAGAVGAVIVRHQDVDLSETVERYRGSLPIRVVEGTRGAPRSTHLWEGLRAVTAEYFGVLDDDDVLHPNHVWCLRSILDARPDVGVAYSGSIRVWEPSAGAGSTTGAAPGVPGPGRASATPVDPAELAYASPFNRSELFAIRNFITSNAFLARATLLRDAPDDPHLPLLEDLFLLLVLSLHSDFVYSSETTCEFYWRDGGADNCSPVLAISPEWQATMDDLARMIWSGRLLAPGAPPDAIERYLAALGTRGLEVSKDYRDAIQQRDDQVRRAEALAGECARREEALSGIARSKGWRAVLAFRRARDRALTGYAQLVRRVHRR